jgi:beta-lactamase superfamily II metal-dependent hydrolase
MNPMQIEIFDVGHGQCAVITTPNGRRMMLDCGDRWGDDRFWTPSLHFFQQTIDLLALMNLDEDHLRDFRNMMHDCTVPWVLSNPTIGSREFAALKKDGAQAVAAWLAQPKNPLPGPQLDFGDVQIRWYYPFFVPGAENKTNDLSLAVIAQFGAFKILFAGDLEVAGWRRSPYRMPLKCAAKVFDIFQKMPCGWCPSMESNGVQLLGKR